jgi:hypothetical protein
MNCPSVWPTSAICSDGLVGKEEDCEQRDILEAGAMHLPTSNFKLRNDKQSFFSTKTLLSMY